MTEEKKRLPVDPDLEFIEDLLEGGGDSLKKCFQCGTCSVVCNLAPADHPFPRQEMIWAQWGLRDKLLADPNVWLCHQCSDCTAKCPRGAKPGDVLAAIRRKAIAALAFPSFMGAALVNPSYWPFLFAFPAAILLATMLAFGQFQLPPVPVVFGNMVTHLQLNVIFPFFTGLAALAFLAGVYKLIGGITGQPTFEFLKTMDVKRMYRAVYDVVVKILTHRDFDQCEANKWRRLAHLLVFYAFGGLLLTTALAIVVLVEADYKEYLPAVLQINLGEYPMNMTHPVKWLGNLSALALILGAGLMIVNRLKLGQTGDLKSSVYDLFFLYIVFGVGLTGFLAQILRYAEIPLLAYPTYFVHLVLVFSLLVYSPYSKFAHLIYRTVALVYIRYRELGPASAVAKPETAAESPAA